MNKRAREYILRNIGNMLTEAINSGELDDVIDELYTGSMDAIISDTRQKCIKAALAKGGEISPGIAYMIAQEAGNSEGGLDLSAMLNDDKSVVDAYAEHIKNYLYTYKDEATAIDPSIDPNEEQIGPMAQDIEQVNPACVKELDDGTKVVDTERLSLMNAGAIADLARDIKALKEALNG